MTLKNSKKFNKIKKFWESRAKLGITAGTNDFILTEIEQNFILNFIPKNARILDIGCGNSMSLIQLASKKKCTGIGIDFAAEMINQSKKFIELHRLKKKLEVHQSIIPPIPLDYGKFDIVMSNRCLINLQKTQQQKEAIQSIPEVLKSKGIFLMIECFMEGNNLTNSLRKKLGLKEILPPWHNLFFKLKEVKSWQTKNFKIEKILHISSTYHFLSRVIYAKLAKLKSQKLVYDSEINRIALNLPQEFGQFGPVKAVVWRKI